MKRLVQTPSVKMDNAAHRDLSKWRRVIPRDGWSILPSLVFGPVTLVDRILEALHDDGSWGTEPGGCSSSGLYDQAQELVCKRARVREQLDTPLIEREFTMRRRNMRFLDKTRV